MNEKLTNQPELERVEVEAKQFEAACVARVVGVLYEIFHGEVSGQNGADWALDDMGELCKSLAKHDPEMGLMLIEALEAHPKAVEDIDTYNQMRKDLGLPLKDDEYWTPSSQRTADQAPSQPGSASPPSPEHNQ